MWFHRSTHISCRMYFDIVISESIIDHIHYGGFILYFSMDSINYHIFKCLKYYLIYQLYDHK